LNTALPSLPAWLTSRRARSLEAGCCEATDEHVCAFDRRFEQAPPLGQAWLSQCNEKFCEAFHPFSLRPETMRSPTEGLQAARVRGFTDEYGYIDVDGLVNRVARGRSMSTAAATAAMMLSH